MHEVVSMDRLAQAVGLILQIGGQGGQSDGWGTDVDGQALPLVPVVAEWNTRQTHRAPVTVHLAVGQFGVLELEPDVRVGHSAGHLELPPADPILVVRQSGSTVGRVTRTRFPRSSSPTTSA